MLDKVLGRDHPFHMYIDVTPLSFHGRCSGSGKIEWMQYSTVTTTPNAKILKLPLVLSMMILLNGGMRRNIVGIFMVTDHSIRGMS